MRTIQTNEGQTILDIAMQYCGDSETAVTIALLNVLDIDDLLLGQSLLVPDTVIDKQAIVTGFRVSNIVPASALTPYDNYEDEWALYYTTGLPSSHG